MWSSALAIRWRLSGLNRLSGLSGLIRLSVVAMGALSTSGCGPITAHTTIAKARIAIASTEKARITLASTNKSKRADELAVFEYHSALLYLDKAKREEGRASYQEAITFATRAIEFADRARSQMLEDVRVRPRPQMDMRQPNAFKRQATGDAGSAPSTSAPMPSAPMPSAPMPSAPIPSAPTPSAPMPAAPAPAP